MRLEYFSGADDLAEEATAAGLPELTGTAEEIAQAEYIRAELLDSAGEFLRKSWELTAPKKQSFIWKRIRQSTIRENRKNSRICRINFWCCILEACCHFREFR